MSIRRVTRFSEMNQYRVGLAGLVGITALLLLALTSGKVVSMLGFGGQSYTATFAEAGGLKGGNAVMVSGFQVGKVQSVALHGNTVAVRFTADGVRLGELTRAAIKVKNPLGAKFLDLKPEGPGELSPDQGIPLSRTTAPYSLPDALSQLTVTAGKIDVKLAAKAFDTLSETFKDTPPELRATLHGVGRLSEAIASRDDELRELLSRANSVTGVLAQRNMQITKLMVDGNALFQELERRRQVIHELLVNIKAASRQVSGLAADNRATLRPTLDELARVTAVLKKNEENLDFALRTVSGFGRGLNEGSGSGPWFYGLIQNLVPTNLAQAKLSALLPDLGLPNQPSPTRGGSR